MSVANNRSFVKFVGLIFIWINCVRAANESQCSNELFVLANGPSKASTYTACIVNGVRFVVHSRDVGRTTQNSGVSTTGLDGTKYYGLLEEILELTYISGYRVVLFRCKWFRTDNQQCCVTKNNITSISTQTEWFVEDQYILATQAKQVFYLDDPSKSRQRGESSQNYWKVVQEVNHRKIWDRDIVVEDDEDDVVHDSNSSDLSLCAELDHLTYTSLSIGQSIEVEDIPSSKDKEEDFIHDSEEDIDDNDEEDSDSEQECEQHNSVARGHGGDTGGDPPPSGNWLPPSGNCGGGGSKKGRGPARNVEMRALWKKNGYRHLPIEFDALDGTWMPIGPNGDYFKSFVGNLMKDLPLYYERWDKVPTEVRMPILPKIQVQREMVSKKRGVMQSEQLRQIPPPDMSLDEWSKYMDFFCDDKVVRRSQVNKEVRAKQVNTSLQGRTSFTEYRHRLRDPVTMEPPSLIDQYAQHRSRDGVFTDETFAENHRRMVFMRDAQVGSQNPMTEREILANVLGERRGHVRGVGKKVGSSSSSTTQSTAQSSPMTRLYTQAEVDAKMEKMKKKLRSSSDKKHKAVYEALRRAGIPVDEPDDDEETSDDSDD
ncbi:hypothetical protein OSB04_019001 [Centaurea solstitialis]|uniref:DUF4216 domain-containing protein n=1 Tax=Centaurea solstitialis TaxID=347529 RepID=A0AA38T8Y9_9ASTR|nr:hypothetical protein OSB04_019001 [Centaurea solstitialis]